MPRIGLRELKTRASEVTRDIQQNHVRYTVTNRGEPVAMIIPYTPFEEIRTTGQEDARKEFLELREQIGRGQTEPFDVADLMEELRR